MKDVFEKLRKVKAKRVFVQFPEGIRLRIPQIVKELEREGFEIVVCTEACFGSCDIRDNEAKAVGCDTILHIGHEDFGCPSSLPVVFWEYFIDVDPTQALEKNLDKLKNFQNIGLITSIQFVHAVPIAKEFLEKNGKEVFTYKALQHEGQILGCNLEAAKKIEDKVDCFLCITAGKFYGRGLVMKTDKPLLSLDLEKNEIESMEEFKKKVQKIVAWNKSQLSDAKRVGLLVSWKKGQYKSVAFDLKKKLEKGGKDVFILAMDEILPEKLEGLKLDAVINFACPRLGTDDISRFKTPILNWDQVEV